MAKRRKKSVKKKKGRPKKKRGPLEPLFNLKSLHSGRRRKAGSWKTPAKILAIAILAFGFYQLSQWHPEKKASAPAVKTSAPSEAKREVKKTPAPRVSTPPREVKREPARSVAPSVPTPPALPAVTPPAQHKLKPWTHRPKMVFVIDDIGNNREQEALFRKLGDKVTYAILPLLRYSKFYGELSRQTGTEVILHLPLEAKNGEIPGPGLITTQMDPNYVIESLHRNLGTVPNHVGVNNHMGSYGTKNYSLMATVLKEIKRRGLFFLDSQTTSESVAPRIASHLNLPILKRDIFLDNVDEKEAIRAQVVEAAAIARQKGVAIAIGHDRKNTLEVLIEEIPALEEAGFQIVSLSDIIHHHWG